MGGSRSSTLSGLHFFLYLAIFPAQYRCHFLLLWIGFHHKARKDNHGQLWAYMVPTWEAH